MNLRKDHYRFFQKLLLEGTRGKARWKRKRGGRRAFSSCSTYLSDVFVGRSGYLAPAGWCPFRRTALGGLLAPTARFKEHPLQRERGEAAPPFRRFRFYRLYTVVKSLFGRHTRDRAPGATPVAASPGPETLKNGRMKTLSGGSLGLRVDEERSQLRELM